MSAMVFQIIGVSIVCATVCSGADQSSASLAFVRGIHRWPVNSPYKGPVTRKMFTFDGGIMVLNTKAAPRELSHRERMLKYAEWQFAVQWICRQVNFSIVTMPTIILTTLDTILVTLFESQCKVRKKQATSRKHDVIFNSYFRYQCYYFIWIRL